jgi:hypothetical protein
MSFPLPFMSFPLHAGIHILFFSYRYKTNYSMFVLLFLDTRRTPRNNGEKSMPAFLANIVSFKNSLFVRE